MEKGAGKTDRVSKERSTRTGGREVGEDQVIIRGRMKKYAAWPNGEKLGTCAGGGNPGGRPDRQKHKGGGSYKKSSKARG